MCFSISITIFLFSLSRKQKKIYNYNYYYNEKEKNKIWYKSSIYTANMIKKYMNTYIDITIFLTIFFVEKEIFSVLTVLTTSLSLILHVKYQTEK